MRQGLLSNRQFVFLQKEKHALQEAIAILSQFSLPREDLDKLRGAAEQLDELFLIVAAGEFNAGKSALLNALLGETVLEEGVTPTTAQVTLLRWGEQAGRLVVDDGFAIVTHPLPLLQELNMVDSPGTNAINRQHERLTSDYVPRSDLVLFVTSADRPLTQSERLFLEKILKWGKKVSLVINKIDILESENAREEAVILLVISPNTGVDTGFYLGVDDPYALHRRLIDEGVIFMVDPEMGPIGVYTSFRDTDGNIIRVVDKYAIDSFF